MTVVGMAIAGMRRRRLRTVLTILSVAVSIAVLTATLSTQAAIGGLISEAQDNPRVHSTSSNNALTLPLAYVEQASKLPGVRWTFYGRITLGDDGRRLRFPVVATNFDSYKHQTPSYWQADSQESIDRGAKDKAWLRPTPALLERMNWKIGERVTFHTMFGNVTGTIYGTCTGFACMQPMMFMDFDALDQMVPPETRGRISYFSAGTTAAEQQNLIRTIDEKYAKSSDPTLTVPSDEFIRANFMRSVGAVPALLAKVNWLLLLVTAMVMISMLVVSLRERRNEFGTLRAIGFSRARVFQIIVCESIAVCLIGGVVGAAIPFLLFHSEGIHMGGFVIDAVRVTAKACGYAIAASGVLGVLIALVPALAMARLDILKALEGA